MYYRPSAIPGPVPDELVLPATDSIGTCPDNLGLAIIENVCSCTSFNPNLPLSVRCKIAAEDGMAPWSFN